MLTNVKLIFYNIKKHLEIRRRTQFCNNSSCVNCLPSSFLFRPTMNKNTLWVTRRSIGYNKSSSSQIFPKICLKLKGYAKVQQTRFIKQQKIFDILCCYNICRLSHFTATQIIIKLLLLDDICLEGIESFKKLCSFIKLSFSYVAVSISQSFFSRLRTFVNKILLCVIFLS